jgi:hypothetical protein
MLELRNHDIIHPDDRDDARAMRRLTAGDVDSYEAQMRIIRAEGRCSTTVTALRMRPPIARAAHVETQRRPPARRFGRDLMVRRATPRGAHSRPRSRSSLQNPISEILSKMTDGVEETYVRD